MATYKRWTPEEDKLLLDTVSKYPENYSKAFRELSTKLDRTIYSCSNRYYYLIFHKDNKSVPNLVMFSKKKAVKNRKVDRREHTDTTTMKCSLFRKIYNLIFK